ncbi:DUF4123 domain-containing protein [Modicisalibacter radicis]|uniref:DUF4123 domain-containing protein n=1 Tax=Halomonas sp. EAR18 TaxID=2518972 RepID=UPI00109D2227|nr:DUF4123 domain-containing protein [Halomonas sp. EAR18]
MSLSDEALKSRVSGYVQGLEDVERGSASVCAVIETGLLSEDERNALWKRFRGHPWLQQSQFQVLQPLGPWLFDDDIETLLSDVYPLAERGFHGVLITHQPVAQEAVKLGKLCVVKDANGEEQLLRFYAPNVMPVLHRFSDMPWYDRLFGSLGAWWLPGLDGWEEFAGGWESLEGAVDSEETITLTPALLQAIGSDPMTHRILGELEQSSPALFNTACPGLRLAMVDKAIESARASGFDDIQDLSVYAAYCVAYGMQVVGEPDFFRAVEMSAQRPRSLAENLKAVASHSVSEEHHG